MRYGSFFKSSRVSQLEREVKELQEACEMKDHTIEALCEDLEAAKSLIKLAVAPRSKPKDQQPSLPFPTR